MATPLGTSFTDDEVVAQSDVNLAGTMVETLVVEFNQAKFEEALSFGSLSPKARRKIHKVSKKTQAPSMADLPKEYSPRGLDCSYSFFSEEEKSAPTELVCRVTSSASMPKHELRVNQVKRAPQGRVSTTKRKLHARVSQRECSPQGCGPLSKRTPQGCVSEIKRVPQGRVSKLKRAPQGRVSKLKRAPQGHVSKLKRAPQGRVSYAKRVPHGRVSHTKREPQASVSKRERSLQGRGPLTKRSHQGHVSPTTRGPRVQDGQSKRDPRVSNATCQVAFRATETSLKRQCWVPIQTSRLVSSSSRVFATDLRKFLSRERPIRLTSTVPSKYQGRSYAAISSNDASDDEYPGVTINMVSRGKSPASSSDEPGANRSPSVKEISDKFEGIYKHTRTREGVIPPVDYERLAEGLEPDDEPSAIAEAQSSSSFVGHQSPVSTTESAEEFRKKLEELQVVMQEHMLSQQEAMRLQQETIDQLRVMVVQLVADEAQFRMFGSKPHPESSRRRGRSPRRKINVNKASAQEARHVKSSSEEEKKTGNEPSPQSAKMEELEARISAIANRSELQDEGSVRPYPAEWDSIPYPPKFKAPTLQAFDGKGSPNQHIYHFKSQTGNVISSDAILTRLFIGTLKGVAFEWFIKLPAGCIQKWIDLERLFLSRFFEDDTEVSIHTFLATKQKEGESIQAFVKRFRSVALRCPTGMTQYALVETCRRNLQTKFLARMGVAECLSWRQLISQGEHAQEILARIEAEEESKQWDQSQSSQSEGEDTTDTENNHLQ